MRWYSYYYRHCSSHPLITGLRPREQLLGIFVKALVDLLRPRNQAAWPATLALDFERLKKVRLELHAHLAIEICLSKYQAFAVDDLFDSRSASSSHMAAFRSAIIALQEDQDSTASEDLQARWQRNSDKIAVEMFRHAGSVAPEAPFLTPVELRTLELCLSDDFQLRSPAWNVHENISVDGLWAQTLERTVKYLGMSPVAVAGQKVSDADGTGRGGIEGMVGRLAQVACLHWKVWSELVYLPGLAKRGLLVRGTTMRAANTRENGGRHQDEVERRNRKAQDEADEHVDRLERLQLS
jgi:hypothetical protein